MTAAGAAGREGRDMTPDAARPPGAILLAGGRASRVGGAAKPLFEVNGRTLLAHAVDAVDGCRPVTIVASALRGAESWPQVSWVREEPPFGGPAAGIVAALASWPPEADPEWTLVLACDLPRAGEAVARLRADLPLLPVDADGLCLADASSRPQWLTGMYRTAALRARAEALPGAGANLPVREIVEDLSITVIADVWGLSADIDTWEDLDRARRSATDESKESGV